MKIKPAPLAAEYTRLRARLARLGWVSHGYVQDRGPGAGGPCYQWTRKVKGKRCRRHCPKSNIKPSWPPL